MRIAKKDQNIEANFPDDQLLDFSSRTSASIFDFVIRLCL